LCCHSASQRRCGGTNRKDRIIQAVIFQEKLTSFSNLSRTNILYCGCSTIGLCKDKRSQSSIACAILSAGHSLVPYQNLYCHLMITMIA
jgi:hypothetical protein